MAKLSHPDQADLLEWAPPETSVRFADDLIRAGTLRGRISKAISAALDGLDRTVIARAMSDYLGEPVSKAMVDGYAATSAKDHSINVLRLMALLHVTADRRLLQMLAEPHGWTVIDAKHEPLIRLAAIKEQEERLRRQSDVLRREARLRGAL